MSEITDTTKHDAMMAKILSGQKLESIDEITDDYKRVLIAQLRKQAVGELAGAHILLPWIKMAPTIDEMVDIAMMTKDEARHAKVCFDLLESLGVPTGEYYKQNHLYRSPFFSKRLKTWTQLVVFNFFLFSSADHHFPYFSICSWCPYNRMMRKILDDEVMHIAHGDSWMERLSQSPRTREEAQCDLNYWFPKINSIFGSSEFKLNKASLKYKIQLRSSQEMRLAWYAEIKEKLEKNGYQVPPVEAIEYAKPHPGLVLLNWSGQIAKRWQRIVNRLKRI